MGISEQSTLLCEQKLLTSRQIFRYAVPARTVTKKALLLTQHLRIPATAGIEERARRFISYIVIHNSCLSSFGFYRFSNQTNLNRAF